MLRAAITSACAVPGLTVLLCAACSLGCSGGARPNAVPDGWNAHQVEALRFALPSTMSESTQSVPEATVTFSGPLTIAGVDAESAAGVFVEAGEVGSLAIRTTTLRDTRSDQLGVEPRTDPEYFDVPGAAGGSVVTWRSRAVYPRSGETVDFRQAEILVAVADGPQYGISIGGDLDVITDEVIAEVVDSLAVIEEPAGA